MPVDDIYDEFESRLHRFAMSLSHDADTVNDLVQETFIRALPHIRMLDGLSPQKRRSWLFRVLKNLFVDEWRTRRRQAALVEQLASDAGESTDPIALALGLEVLGDVPARDRELLEQRYVLGLNSREIADALGVPPATVRSRLHVAIKRLRARREELFD